MPMGKKDLFDSDSGLIQSSSVLAGGSSQPFIGTPYYAPKPMTTLLVPVVDDDGNSVIQEKILETITNPLDFLSYDDFRLSKLLSSGVQPQAIKIIPDHRLGVDDVVISQFNDHLDQISDSLYEKVD